ncbi:LUD domain-containing protein [Agriterribacter sp.]|uniref:LutC/YkgG family protein n=1 Tax=Agriterribacter sp. TaxID=2821509 RepID=UPI002C4D23BA|nr:LUD domain-containing protein [Agriterribacter sp.]HRP57242.1 LUD domain-containing protein [Agriterribacter sp.]
MKVSPAKENMLKKIRKALSTSVPLPFPQSEGNNSVFLPPADEAEIVFAEAFGKQNGRFLYCASETELLQQLSLLIRQRQWKEVFCKEILLRQRLATLNFAGFSKKPLHFADAAITGCEALIARTGTIMMSAAQQSGRTTSVYAPVHICVAHVAQLVYDIKDGLQLIKEKYTGRLPSLITFATGPSRTADIEKTLVVGVHGPKEVFVFLTEN